MYLWLRNTHLWLGLLSVVFLLMYGLSSVQMAHNTWFKAKPAVTESRVPIRPESGGSARAVARELMDLHEMRGELAQVKETENGVKFRILRPGTVYEVDYSDLTREAHIRTNVASFMGLLNRIHHIAGVWHDYALINVWGVFIGLVSAGLLVLGLTGIYLWFKIHSEWLIGGVLLAIGLGYGLTLIVLLRMA